VAQPVAGDAHEPVVVPAEELALVATDHGVLGRECRYTLPTPTFAAFATSGIWAPGPWSENGFSRPRSRPVGCAGRRRGAPFDADPVRPGRRASSL
jgi:hypothetical protein